MVISGFSLCGLDTCALNYKEKYLAKNSLAKQNKRQHLYEITLYLCA